MIKLVLFFRLEPVFKTFTDGVAQTKTALCTSWNRIIEIKDYRPAPGPITEA